MTSRDKILNAVSANQPKLVLMPTIDLSDVISYEDNFLQFKTVLEGIGGKVELIHDITTIFDSLEIEKSLGKLVINTLDENYKIDINLTSFELEKLEIACIKGSLGVAENGSIWVYESQMWHRLLPFICQHLILVIDKKDIVPTMHQAYQKIDITRDGFGVFIAGPSKTADIEQSLVIGAHGARTATIYVVD
jgi:L-lactate dehydrogenase complex protein LldG